MTRAEGRLPKNLSELSTQHEHARQVANDLRAFVHDGMDPKLAAKLLAIACELENQPPPRDGKRAIPPVRADRR
jgi:hypothetical protein